VKELFQSLKEGWQRKEIIYVPKKGKPRKSKDERKKRMIATKKRQLIKPVPYSIFPSVFDSIKTLVVNNWDEICETGNVFLLSKSKSQDRSNKFLRYCLDIWDSIRDQEIKKFDTLNKEYFSKIAEVAILKAQFAITQDNWDLFLLELAEDELEGITQVQGKRTNIAEVKFILQKSGIDINMRKDTVDDYYTALELHKKIAVDAR